MKPGAFMRELWGVQPPGFPHLWELKTKRTLWLPASDTADMAAGANTAAGRADIYCSVALAHRRYSSTQRLQARQATGIAGLWLDIDVIGPTHTTGVASADAAWDLCHRHLEPTLVVDSGWGLHAWWLLASGPWRFASQEEQDLAASLARRIHALHGLGQTSDLSRILRLPGTINAKVASDPRQVKVIEGPGPRYPLAALITLLDGVPDHGSVTRLPGTVDVKPTGPIDPQILSALLANSEQFADAWHHRVRLPSADDSLSAYDLSICSIAAHAGMSDEQLAGLITAHRLHHDPTDTKHQRGNYINKTISKARSVSEKDAALDRMRARLGAAA